MFFIGGGRDKDRSGQVFAKYPILEFNIDDNNEVSFYRIYNPDIRL
ncbi:hypothetical protein [Anaerococcus sp.]|nr:hypothetical protein [Anaerococcus sp.]